MHNVYSWKRQAKKPTFIIRNPIQNPDPINPIFPCVTITTRQFSPRFILRLVIIVIIIIIIMKNDNLCRLVASPTVNSNVFFS